MTLEELVKATAGKPDDVAVFNNAAQIWNHTFYWNSMRAKGGGKPTGRIAQQIDASFGSFDAFREAFSKAALTQFGSGWAWLVKSGEKLEIAQDRQRRHAPHAGQDAAAHHRRLGARLLPRLPEPPQGLRRRLARQPGELGVRREEPGLGGERGRGRRPRLAASRAARGRALGGRRAGAALARAARAAGAEPARPGCPTPRGLGAGYASSPGGAGSCPSCSGGSCSAS